MPGYWPGPAYPTIWCWPSKSVMAGCQMHSNQPPFKSLALPPSPLFAATSAPPSPASLPVSALKRSMWRPRQATSWRARVGQLVLRWTYVTNLQVEQNTYITTMDCLVPTLLAQWLSQLDTLCEVLGSILPPSKFLLVKNMYETICFCTFHVCAWYMHGTNKC
jgi:hypothetical protein